MLPRALLVLFLASLAFIPVGCSKNAVTGENSLLFLSKDDEVKMGAEAAPQFTQQFGGAVPNQQLQAYVSNIGRKLAATTEQDFPSFPWEFTLLNSDVINAFALPGGKVFITRGLCARMTNEAQLAGVLGHEVGHVTARHSNQQMSKQMILGGAIKAAEVGAGVAGDSGAVSTIGQIGIPALQVGGNVILLKYGRKDESQADELGMRYMQRAGYNPAAQMQVMQILQEASAGDRQPEWLSTHPYPETRIERIKQLLATTYANAEKDPNLGFHEQEFRTNFLAVLNSLPPAPDAQGASGASKGLRPSSRGGR